VTSNNWERPAYLIWYYTAFADSISCCPYCPAETPTKTH